MDDDFYLDQYIVTKKGNRAVTLREYRTDLLRQVREAVEAVNTTVPVGYTMTPRAMTIGEFRAEVLAAIDKLGAPAKGE